MRDNFRKRAHTLCVDYKKDFVHCRDMDTLGSNTSWSGGHSTLGAGRCGPLEVLVKGGWHRVLASLEGNYLSLSLYDTHEV